MRFCSSTSLVLLAFFASALADPAILNLKDYSNGTVYMPNNLEDGGNLYIASNDDLNSLKNIQLSTGGITYSLSDLSTVNPDGTPQKITISNGLTITSNNPNSATNMLTGYLYVTTKQQAEDPSFGVYVITGSHHISLNGVASTTVILNTQIQAPSGDADQPQKSTYLKNLMMTSTENVYFQWGIPSVNWKTVTDNKFFMNPFNYKTYDTHVSSNRLYFDNVEPLQIGLDYWYITSSGPIVMDMQNAYVPNHNTTTTSVNTTGLLVNSNFLFDQHTVNFQSDPTRSRTVGSLLTAYVSSAATVSFVFNGTDGSIVQKCDNTKNTTQQVSVAPVSAQTLTVTSTDITAGVFYCQYFSISTNTLPVVSSTSTAVPPIGTGSTQQPPVTAGTAGTGSTIGIATGGPPASTVANSNPTVTTTGTSGNVTTTTTTTTVATTTKSGRSLSVVSSILVFLGFFMF